MSLMRDEEAMEIFKKYDKNLYDYYIINARGFGIQSLMYAEYLKNQKYDKEGELK